MGNTFFSEPVSGQKKILKGTEAVLVVDDEDMVRTVTREMLESLGYTVFTAANGGEALELFRAHHDSIDLVILDMVLPRIGGGSTYEALKAIAPRVKILLASGYSVNSHASAMLARGCDGFIQKPCDLRSLSRKVREILDSA